MLPRDSRPARALRGLRARVACLAATIALLPSTAASAQLGPIVATVEVDAPTTPTAVVQATVPVPKGTFLPDRATTPLALVDPAGQTLTTQVEVVARYPDPADGASVVEVLGLDPDPAAHGPGKLTYLVRTDAAPRTLAPYPPRIPHLLSGLNAVAAPAQSLVANKGQVLLAGTDVFGNIYVLDLLHEPLYDSGAREWRRFGPLRTEQRSHGQLRPIAPLGGPTATLPHHLGVHSYVRVTSGDPVVELDLRLHNGADGSSALNPPLADLYFNELVLLLPQGWTAAPVYGDPTVGQPYDLGPFYRVFPLIAPNADGTPHFMPQQGQLHRRLVLAPETETVRAKAHADREGLGFVRPGPGGASSPLLWSWWNGATANFFPQRHQLPRLDQIDPAKLGQDLTTAFVQLRDHLALGTGDGIYPVVSGDLGWAHPYGVAYGGMTGGDGIEFLWGIKSLVAGSRDGYRRFEVLHRMNTERMPNALYRLDGEPSRLGDWLQVSSVTGETYVDFFFYMHPTGSNDPWGFTTAPTHQVEHVKANGLEPAYEAALAAYEHYDIQHLVRYTGPAKLLAWVGNDSLAKDDLELQAELIHLSYHPFHNSAYGHVQGTGMRADIDYVAANPAQGFPFGRAEGWSMDTMTAAFVLGNDDFRQRKLPWLQSIAQLIVQGQEACSGFLQSEIYVKILGGNYRGRQVVEESIVQNGALGVLRSVLVGLDPVRAQMLEDALRHSLYALIGPIAWDPAQSEPWSQTATGPLDLALPGFCTTLPSDGTSGITDSWQQWASLAYGLELTGDPAFLLKAETMLGMPLFQLTVDQDLSSLGNRAALHAVVEFLLDSL